MSPARRSTAEMSTAEARQRVGERLRNDEEAIAQELLARVEALSNDGDVDPEYALGLRESVYIALKYGISCIESSERSLPPVPTQLYAQARLAARKGVEVATVLERYFHGHRLLNVFLEEAAAAEGLLGTNALREIRRVSGLVLERLIAEIREQHADEVRKQAASPEKERVNLVQQQLAGEPVDAAQLNYDFNGFHIGLVGRGVDMSTAVNSLAKALDCIHLTVEPSGAPAWAWLGKRTEPDIDRIKRLVVEARPTAFPIAIGEIGEGLAGWRLTHQQARAAFSVCLKPGQSFFRYGDDPLLATTVGAPLLIAALRRKYMEVFRLQPDGGKKLLETLRAYFASNRNAASAAAKLGVKRQTVTYRLRQAEAVLNCNLTERGAEIEVALRLNDLEHPQADQ